MQGVNPSDRGFTLIEVIVGAAIIGSSIVAILGVYGGLTNLSYKNTSRIQASFLAEEGVEVVRLLRDYGWGANIAPLSVNTTYRLHWNGSVWTATTSQARVDTVFDRTVTFSTVGRDGAYDVVTSGGTIDTGSRKAIVSVSWQDAGATSSVQLETYIFNTFNN